MYVIRKDGSHESVNFNRITDKLRHLVKLGGELSPFVDPLEVAQRTIACLHVGVTTERLDEIASETAAEMSIQHPDYGRFAARIFISRLHRNTPSLFSEAMSQLNEHGLLHEDFYKTVSMYADKFDRMVNDEQDYRIYDYPSIRVLERSYLGKLPNGKTIERPQYLLLRVAIAIHGDDFERVKESFDLMSQGYFTHATPTLHSAGFKASALASCYLVSIAEDSIDGIYDTLRKCALCSKSGGGLGINVSNVRAKGTAIAGGLGRSSGLVPLLRVFNNTARYVDQGGGKRPGAFAIYIEPWHGDVEDVIRLSHKFGVEEERARDLFFALWICDIFMKRVDADEDWSLMCPKQCPGLVDSYGADFERLYLQYEQEGKVLRKVRARELWDLILRTQMETGMPFMLYKDHANRRSNQQHLGTVKGSNLCTEIILHSSKDEIAVCNLASLALPMFVRDQPCPACTTDNDEQRFNAHCSSCFGGVDYEKMYHVVKVMARNLDITIDKMRYPTPETERGNKRHRPIGIGVQGFADALAKLGLAWSSEDARLFNKRTFDIMYRAALHESITLAMHSGSYDSYKGSPLEQGMLQPDLWNQWLARDSALSQSQIRRLRIEMQSSRDWTSTLPSVLSWPQLYAKLNVFGARNSERLAPMPTASTSLVMGNSEAIDPRLSNLFVRRVLTGEFVMVNPFLVRDLERLHLWTPSLRSQLIADNGSVQDIDEIPTYLKERYATVWEIKQRTMLDYAIERSPFIDQSQSLNTYLAAPSIEKLTKVHFYAWKYGLKTGMYYLRSKPAVNPIQFTVDRTAQKQRKEAKQQKQAPTPVAAPSCPLRPIGMAFDAPCDSCSG